MKLPTYEQSEKYSSGDVVVVTAVPMEESEDEEDTRHRESPLYRSGTLLEFILFFFSEDHLMFDIVLEVLFVHAVE